MSSGRQRRLLGNRARRAANLYRALLVGDRKVVGITPDATRTSTSHPNTDPSRCACGGRPETADGVLLPIGVGLHDDCWTHAAGERTWSK
jgi:hypothetical protein